MMNQDASIAGSNGPPSRLPATAIHDDVGAPAATPILTQYVRALIRWRWAIIAIVAICVMIGVAVTVMTTPKYRAVAVIEIARESSNVVDIKGVEPQAATFDQEFYETQYGLLRSRTMAEAVVRKLNLANDVNFFVTYGVDPKKIPGGGTGASSGAVRDKRNALATGILLDNVDVRPARMSRLVEIRFSSPDPLLTSRVANAWAEQFINSNLERRFDATSYARKFLESRLEQTRRRLEESQRNLVAYAGREGIVNIGAETQDREGQQRPQSLAAQEITSINEELAKATAERIAAEGAASQAGGGSGVIGDLANPTISNLRSRRAEASAALAKLLAQFEPSYPPAAALKSEVTSLDRAIEGEQGRVRGALSARYREAVSRENQLKGRVGELKGSLLDLQRRSIQYNIFQRDVDTNRTLYEGLLQRYKEIGIAGGVGANNVAIVDLAKTPVAPYQPRPFVNLLLALIAGLGLGVLVALILEQIDEGLTDSEAVERALGVPLLGVSPMVKGAETRDVLLDPKSDLAEAYSTIRTSLSFATASGVPRTLTVTSTRPGEGKTTSSYAIALALARSGKSVLLVDADLRSPSVHHLLNLRNNDGLSSILSGGKTVAEVVQKTGELNVITTGPRPPNPAELLAGGRLDELIATERGYDHIVFDSPPVMGLADAPLLANSVDGVIFVVEARKTRARFARVALDRLHQAHAHLVGCVLTKYDPRRTAMGYAYEYGYSYGRPSTAGPSE